MEPLVNTAKMQNGAEDGNYVEVQDKNLQIEQLKQQVEQLKLDVEQLNGQKANLEEQSEDNEKRLTELAFRIRNQDIDYNALGDENSDVIDAFNDLVEELEDNRVLLAQQDMEREEQKAEIEKLDIAHRQLMNEFEAQRTENHELNTRNLKLTKEVQSLQ